MAKKIFNHPTMFPIPGVYATGEYFFVDYTYGSDLGRGTMKHPFKTLEYAYSKADSGDAIILIGSAAHPLSAMLTIAKNRITIAGLDGGFHGRWTGQNAKIEMGVTTVATDIAAILNTGIRNVIQNVKVISNNTKAESIYTMIDAGEYLKMLGCEIYKSTDLDVTGAAEFVCNGDNGLYEKCTFGSLADARSGAVIRPVVLFTKEIGGAGKVTRDARFEDCQFWIQSTNTANRFMYGANATDIERVCTIKNSLFQNNGAASATPAQNIAFGSSLTTGYVHVVNCSSIKAATAMSTTTGVFVDGPVPAADTTGIALQAS
jgi:hypothetical protein